MFDLIVIVINVEFNTIKPNEKHSDANNTIRSKATKKTIEYEHDFFVLQFGMIELLVIIKFQNPKLSHFTKNWLPTSFQRF
jgi:hypothetical protein